MDYWAGKWAEHGSANRTHQIDQINDTNISTQLPETYFDSLDNQTYLMYYAALMATLFAFSLAKFLVFAALSSKISKRLFKLIFWNILRRPLSFFNRTHSGVVINRCTDDIEIIDYTVPKLFTEFLNESFFMLGSFVLSGFSTPLILIVMVPLFWLMSHNLKIYLKTSTELRRLGRMSRSPILTTVSELMNGLATIRLYNYQNAVLDKWRQFHNNSQRVLLHELYARLWVLVRCEFTLVLVYSLVFVLVVYGKAWGLNGSADPAVFGLLLSAIFKTGSTFYRLLLCFGNLANNVSVVERVKEYIDDQNFVKEFDEPKIQDLGGEWNSEAKADSWPAEGRVCVRDLKVRYREGLPLVLDGVSFVMEPGERVGVVGRTGSGKSTLILCLTRILEFSEAGRGDGGLVTLDGVDISKIGLHVLRRRIAVIPQDPYLIQGTLRSNIDPYSLYTDSQILDVLGKLEFFETLSSSSFATKEGQDVLNNLVGGQKRPKNDLSFKIGLKGGNLSQGQKQLVCIARALVSRPRVLLMDEATSNLDQKLDAVIQRVIKTGFKNTSILTVAHRLETIIEYNKVIAMDKGKVLEQGSPLELIDRKGYFYELLSQGGQSYLERIRRLAAGEIEGV